MANNLPAKPHPQPRHGGSPQSHELAIHSGIFQAIEEQFFCSLRSPKFLPRHSAFLPRVFDEDRVCVDLKTTNPKAHHSCASLSESHSMVRPKTLRRSGNKLGNNNRSEIASRNLWNLHACKLHYSFPMKTSAGSLNLVHSLRT